MVGALYHPAGGILRHDAVVWGYARAADRRGVEIHPYTEVTGPRAQRRPHRGVETTAGRHRGGHGRERDRRLVEHVAGMAGLRLPMTTHILQAFVTEPMKPLLQETVVSSQMRLYVSQTTAASSSPAPRSSPTRPTTARAR